MSKTLEEKINELEAREQIKEVIANYNHGYDKQDAELFMDIWEEYAIWDLGDPQGSCQNKEEILERLQLSWRDIPQTHHYTVNIVISFDRNTGEATAISDVDATAINKEGVPSIVAGTYYDKLSNRSGKWRFIERKIKIRHSTPVSEVR